ncbi:MAG: alpha/beta hydrolase [Marinoscillum sp.]
MKFLVRTGVVLIILLIVYLVGPKVQFLEIEPPGIDPWNISLDSLDKYVKIKDLEILKLKPNNESRIIWADSLRKTRYSVVYLHGFSASPMESNPVPFEFAKAFGFNLYLPLLPGHGRDDRESFVDLQPNDLIVAAKEAIAIGQLLGEDVIVMSCSTGSTLSIYLAGANKEIIDALIMYSPNIELEDPTAKMITMPWGMQIMKAVTGDYWNPNGEGEGDGLKYWTTTYRTEGLLALQALLDRTMKPEIFKLVTQPYFIGYYYKNEEEKDPTISIEAITWFDKHTSTPERMKELVAFPGAGGHVITNPIKSQASEEVLLATMHYTESVLKLLPKDTLK